MRRDPQDLPDAEPAVLKRLWQRGPATIGQLTDAVYPESTEANTTAAPGWGSAAKLCVAFCGKTLCRH